MSGRLALQGAGVSVGTAVGAALVLEPETVPVFRYAIAPEAVGAEQARLRAAVEGSRDQLQSIRERLLREVGPRAYIFDAQLLMLDDPLLVQRSLDLIREEAVNAEWALRSVGDELHDLFAGFSDAYLQERGTDLDDVVGRIHLNLAADGAAPSLARLPGPVVLVSGDLSPSQAAEMDWDNVLAIVTDAGSPTYHTAILARSLGIPGVVGLKDATRRIPTGARVAVDGSTGSVLVEPTEADIDGFALRAEEVRRCAKGLEAERPLPATTIDGVRISLQANAEFAEEVASALEYGAEGIGLFRSEYLLGRAQTWPSEEEQVDLYRRLIELMRPHPVTVRVWDLPPEHDEHFGGRGNPAMGERALRLQRRRPEPFHVQLRALLRAAVAGPLRIMFPFATGPSDVAAVREMVEVARLSLRKDGIEHREDAPVGLNIEVPAAAATADLLAREVDFFSVGTNDLIQYLLAVDRADPLVARFYEPLHPAVLRVIDGVVRAAIEHDVPVSVCGEMAADPLQALLLVGLGVRELSMSAVSIPRVKNALRKVHASHAAEVARRCLGLSTAESIEALARQELLGTAEAGPQ
jgi:phosphotransferase system enzyme I (PtsI)